KIVAEPLAAVEIRARASGGNENQIAFRIGRDDRPCVGRAGALRTAVFPRISAYGFWILWNRIPRPLRLSGNGIEAADLATGLANCAIIGDPRANNNRVADDRRRRCFLIIGEVTSRDTKAIAEIDNSVIAKIRDGLACRSIESNQTGIDCCKKNASFVRSRLPITNAARGVIAVAGIFWH